MAKDTTQTTPEDGVWINGALYTPDDLTFREQKRVRALMLELAGSEDEAGLADVMAALSFVVLSRDDPDLTLDDVLDMKPGDIAKTHRNGNGGGKRPPTKRKAGSGTSGSRS